MIFERFIEMFIREIYQTRRGDIIRLMIAEGSRFPSLAEFYYREVISRGIAGMQMLVQFGISRGEIQALRSSSIRNWSSRRRWSRSSGRGCSASSPRSTSRRCWTYMSI